MSSFAVLDQRGGALRGRLQMELESDRPRAELERLVRAAGAPRQVDGAGGEVEGLAVPVENRRRRREAKDVAGDDHRLDRKPADLARGVPVDARPQRARDELRAEADPEHRHAAAHGRGDEALLADEPGELALVVDAHRPAHGDHHVDGVRRRRRVAGEESRRVEARASRLEPGRDARGTFERNVLQDLDAHGAQYRRLRRRRNRVRCASPNATVRKQPGATR